MSPLPRLLALLFAVCCLAARAEPPRPDLRIVLLGTGGPELTPDRQGPATLLIAGDQKLLFDAGRGVLQRLYESRVNVTEVTKVFVTHLHNDHVEGLPSLWMTPWFLLGRDRPMELWGPVGSKGMVAGMRQMYAFDIAHRTNPFNLASNLEVTVHEVEAGPIYSQDGLTVTAIPVWHDDGNPAFGFKVEVAGRSVVLSGDTTYSEALAAAAAGADVVVHNVVAMSDELSRAAEMKPVLGKLTTPEQAARLFGVAKPRLAVLSHIVKKELPGAAGDRTILRRIRAAGYSGPLVMGHDRMVITIGDRVDVARPRSLRGLREADRKATYQP